VCRVPACPFFLVVEESIGRREKEERRIINYGDKTIRPPIPMFFFHEDADACGAAWKFNLVFGPLRSRFLRVGGWWSFSASTWSSLKTRYVLEVENAHRSREDCMVTRRFALLGIQVSPNIDLTHYQTMAFILYFSMRSALQTKQVNGHELGWCCVLASIAKNRTVLYVCVVGRGLGCEAVFDFFDSKYVCIYTMRNFSYIASIVHGLRIEIP